MTILPLLLLCSLALVAGSVVLFIVSARQGDCNQSERLCLLPLEDDDPVPKPKAAAPATPSAEPESQEPRPS